MYKTCLDCNHAKMIKDNCVCDIDNSSISYYRLIFHKCENWQKIHIPMNTNTNSVWQYD